MSDENERLEASPVAAAGYHPALAAIHWVMAVAIIAMLAMGFLALANTPNSDPAKIQILRLHMAGGMFVFALLVVRALVRWRTTLPPHASSGYRLLDGAATWVHRGFYLVILLVVASGFVTARLSGLPEIVFGGSGEPLPPSFEAYPSFTAHAVLTTLLAATVAVHTIAALYHQFVVKDHIFRRLAFRR